MNTDMHYIAENLEEFTNGLDKKLIKSMDKIIRRAKNYGNKIGVINKLPLLLKKTSYMLTLLLGASFSMVLYGTFAFMLNDLFN